MNAACRFRHFVLLPIVLVCAMSAVHHAGAQPKRVTPALSDTGRAAGLRQPEPFPVFSLDSVRYFVRPPASAQATGNARCVVRVNPAGKIAVQYDRRNLPAYEDALRNGLRYVAFRPAIVNGKPVASAVTITAWFLNDTTWRSTEQAAVVRTRFVDVAADSVSRADSPMVRRVRAAGVPIELPPVYSGQDLASNLYYPQETGRKGTDTVIVRVLVERTGVAVHAVIDSSPDPLLAGAAEEAVKNTRFVPALQMGWPVATWIDVPVVFRWSGK